jgi:Sulfotransferase family
MIISHKHRYVFVELPLTGSTAISAELRENYDGIPMLHKHATYLDFLRAANADEKSYFVFSCIRDPLDQAVSFYFKYKTNHRGIYTNPGRATRFKGSIYHRIFLHVDQKRFRFIQDNDADFATYFLRFYKRPYSNWSVLSHKRFDYVIRFENIQEDFSRVLRRIGVAQKRPLPIRNKTSAKDGGYEKHYCTPEVIRRAKFVFGPFMEMWGYSFPSNWGYDSLGWRQRTAYEAVNAFRKFYWRYLRYRV